MGRIYRMGKLEKIPDPKIVYETKQEILRSLNLPQLQYDYNRFIHLINKHYLRYGISDELGNLICDFCEKFLKFIDEYPWSNPSITKSMNKLVKELAFNSNFIKAKFEQYVDSNQLPWRVNIIITSSFGGVFHFLRQYELLVNSFTPGQKLPNNPTDWNRKSLCIELIKQHRKVNGQDSFPKYEVIRNLMKLNGYELPRRTYGDWLRQYRKGTITDLFQDRKNGQ